MKKDDYKAKFKKLTQGLDVTILSFNAFDLPHHSMLVKYKNKTFKCGVIGKKYELYLMALQEFPKFKQKVDNET